MKLVVTQEAQTELVEQLKQYDMKDKVLRLYVAGHGWAGPSFGMALDELKDGDHVENLGEFKVVIEKDLLSNFPEVKVDFINTPQGKGFSVSTGTGGCGEGGCSGC